MVVERERIVKAIKRKVRLGTTRGWGKTTGIELKLAERTGVARRRMWISVELAKEMGLLPEKVDLEKVDEKAANKWLEKNVKGRNITFKVSGK